MCASKVITDLTWVSKDGCRQQVCVGFVPAHIVIKRLKLFKKITTLSYVSKPKGTCNNTGPQTSSVFYFRAMLRVKIITYQHSIAINTLQVPLGYGCGLLI